MFKQPNQNFCFTGLFIWLSVPCGDVPMPQVKTLNIYYGNVAQLQGVNQPIWAKQKLCQTNVMLGSHEKRCPTELIFNPL